MQTKIIEEDKHILVCFKPAGLAVQSSRIGEQDMVSELKNYLAVQKRDGGAPNGKPPYLGVVHRLDQPVSGLVVFAKTPQAAAKLSGQVSAKQGSRSAGQVSAKKGGQSGGSKELTDGNGNCRDVEAEPIMNKEYTALVFIGEGTELPPEGSRQTLEDYLLRDGRQNISRVVLKETQDAKLARLEWEVVERNWKEKAALIRVHLFTGRHHQIRVQLSHAGLPLIGDGRYGTQESKKYSAALGLGSICLCASRLSFWHPATGERVEYSTEEFPWKR